MKNRILVADDEPLVQNIVAKTFAGESYEIIRADNGVDALALAVRENPDLMITDVCMPGKTGWEVLEEMHRNPRTRLIPIIMLTGMGVTSEDEVRGLEAGADEYIAKPFTPSELRARAQCLLRRCRLDLSVNPLTRLPGSPSIEDEVERRIREGRSFSFLYADIDNFKPYNDVYGFAAGDAVIRETASIFMASTAAEVPRGSFVGHIGGDDFVVVADAEHASQAARTAAARFDGAVPVFTGARMCAAASSRPQIGKAACDVFRFCPFPLGESTARSAGLSATRRSWKSPRR